MPLSSHVAMRPGRLTHSFRRCALVGALFVLLCAAGLASSGCGDDARDKPSDASLSDGGSLEAGQPRDGESPNPNPGDAGTDDGGGTQVDAAEDRDGGVDPMPDGAITDADNLCARPSCAWDFGEPGACDTSTCCGDRSCAAGACLTMCNGENVDVQLPTIEPGAMVVGNVCHGLTLPVVRYDDASAACPTLMAYDAVLTGIGSPTERLHVRRAPFDPAVSGQAPTVLHDLPSPFVANSFLERIEINPSGTRAAVSTNPPRMAEMPLDNELVVVDMATGELRELEARNAHSRRFLDDDLLLVFAFALDRNEPTRLGGYVIDTSVGGPLTGELVLDAIQLISGVYVDPARGLVFMGVVPVTGGQSSAYVVVPIARMRAVLAGSEPPINVFTDPDIPRYEVETWQVQGTPIAGRWLIDFVASDYATRQVRSLDFDATSIMLGTPVPIYTDALGRYAFSQVGLDRLAIHRAATSFVIRAP